MLYDNCDAREEGGNSRRLVSVRKANEQTDQWYHRRKATQRNATQRKAKKTNEKKKAQQ